MSTYSRSMLETYARCPRQYKLRYVDRQPDVSGDPALVGTALHSAVERYAYHLFGTKQRSDVEKFGEIAREELSRLPAHLVQEAWRVADSFGDSFVMLLDYVHGLEVRLEAEVGEDKVCGRLDRLDVAMGERAVIHDYKTGHRMLSAGELAEDFQMLLYGLLVRRNFPDVGEIAAVHLYVRLGATRNCVLDFHAIERTALYAEDLIARLKHNREWKARPNVSCGWCPLVAECARAFGFPAAPTPAEAVELHALGSGLLTHVEPLLREYAKDAPVEYDSQNQIGYWPKNSTVWDTAKVMQACSALGLDYAEYLRADSVAAKRLAKRKDEWGRLVRSGMEVKTTTYFGKHRKATMNEETDDNVQGNI